MVVCHSFRSPRDFQRLTTLVIGIIYHIICCNPTAGFRVAGSRVVRQEPCSNVISKHSIWPISFKTADENNLISSQILTDNTNDTRMLSSSMMNPILKQINPVNERRLCELIRGISFKTLASLNIPNVDEKNYPKYEEKSKKYSKYKNVVRSKKDTPNKERFFRETLSIYGPIKNKAKKSQKTIVKAKKDVQPDESPHQINNFDSKISYSEAGYSKEYDFSNVVVPRQGVDYENSLNDNDDGMRGKFNSKDYKSNMSNNFLSTNASSSTSLFNDVRESIIKKIPLIKFTKTDQPSLDGSSSVSSIINKTMPEKSRIALQRWKKKMIAKLGLEGFAAYQKELFRVGGSLHSNINDFLVDGDEEGIIVDPANTGHWQSLEHVLQEISQPVAVESFVRHPELGYHGILDCVALYRDELVLIDWKTSQKQKPKIEHTYDNPLQVVAYVGALNHDSNYSFQVKNAAIVITYEDGSPAHVHFINSELCATYWNLWQERLAQFKNLS